MSIPDFTRAEYEAPPPVSNSTDLNVLLGGAQTLPEAVDPDLPLDSPQAYRRALRYGFINAVIGCILYAVVGHWLILGLVSIVVGLLVSAGLMRGSGGVGGRRYQWTAVILTYFAVSFASTLDLLWEVAQKGQSPGHYITHHIVLLVAFSLLAPFLALIKLGYGLLGLLILFFGLQAAWKGAKGGPDAVAMANKMNERQSNLHGGSNKDGSTLGLR